MERSRYRSADVPQSFRPETIQSETEKKLEGEENAKAPAKDAISLDLSALADLGFSQASAPTRTRT
jgi:hypothetical protein